MSRVAAPAFAVLAIMLAVAALAAAQGLPRSSATLASPPQYFGSRLAAGMTLANYLQNLRSDFAQLDAHGDGEITPADVALHDSVTVATAVGIAAQEIMSADLDGDGAVTEDEGRRVVRYRHHMAEARARANPAFAQHPSGLSLDEQIEQEVRRMMAADTNKDGRITWAEAIAHIKSQASFAQMASFAEPGRRTRQLLALAAAAAGRSRSPGWNRRRSAFPCRRRRRQWDDLAGRAPKLPPIGCGSGNRAGA